MSEDYVPPKVWTWDKANGGAFANVNRPVAGATHDRDLPVGKHPFQLYSLGTPNGQKATIMFEELLAAGVAEAEYDAWRIAISDGDQFGSGFVAINPNSKIPALVDRSGAVPFRVFESGAILMHLAEKFGLFLPTEPQARAEVLSWLFWQVGSAPFMGGGFGHFYHYAPFRIEYAIDRYAMETKRLFDVANRRLAEARFLGGEDYSIADIAAYTWMGNIYRGEAYGEAATFLSMHEYEHVGRWVGEIDARPGVRRGRLVNSQKGLAERHDASDFDSLPPELLAGIVQGY
ncbi:MAG: glutathione-dependent disulfide-bond oxidoreductase [Sphingomonadales bacterium]|nr:glutathione-dependent disulfide-bond oxidoreductase [Sphingomonadales bacterium]